MKFLDCTLVNIGSSEKIEATATIPEGFYCPKVIDNTLWLSGGGYGKEQFKVTQYGTTVSVERIDYQTKGFGDGGWKMDLKFHCCKNEGMAFYIHGHNDSE